MLRGRPGDLERHTREMRLANGKPNDTERAELAAAILKHRDAIGDRFEIMDVKPGVLLIRSGDHYNRKHSAWTWKRAIAYLETTPDEQSPRRAEYLREVARGWEGRAVSSHPNGRGRLNRRFRLDANAQKLVVQRAFEIANKNADMQPPTIECVVLVKDGQLTEEGKRRGIVLPPIARTLEPTKTDNAEKSANKDGLDK